MSDMKPITVMVTVAVVVSVALLGLYYLHTNTDMDIFGRIDTYDRLAEPIERDRYDTTPDYDSDSDEGDSSSNIGGWNNGKIDVHVSDGDFKVKRIKCEPSSAGDSGYGTIDTIKIYTDLPYVLNYMWWEPTDAEISLVLYKWEQLAPMQVDSKGMAKCTPSPSTWKKTWYDPGIMQNNQICIEIYNTNLAFEEEDAYHIVGNIQLWSMTEDGRSRDSVTFTTDAFLTGDGGDEKA